MSLRTAVAAPFRQRGAERMGENEFVVALSLDRDWFSPDQAKRLIDVATGQGLLERDDGDVITRFDADDVTVPAEFVPDESILRERSTFEQVLDEVVADGVGKQEAVADINRLQDELGVTVEAAAVVYARRRGLDVDGAAASALDGLGD
jgi:hypothetical protein